ncbi:hypothetical protein ACVME8_002992 [Bradyrhizobium diazoefficiens]
MLARYNLNDTFRPYLSDGDEIVRSGYLGWAGLPHVFLGWEYYYCLTKTRLCFHTEGPLGKTQYAEVYLEDVISTELSRPSLFYYVIVSLFSGMAHDADYVVRDTAPAAQAYGFASFEFLLWLGEYLLTTVVAAGCVYVVFYLVFLRPTFALRAYGGRILIASSALSSRTKALRQIVQDVYRLRRNSRRFEAMNVIYS